MNRHGGLSGDIESSKFDLSFVFSPILPARLYRATRFDVIKRPPLEKHLVSLETKHSSEVIIS